MLDRGNRYVAYSRNPYTMLEYAGPVGVRGEETNVLLPGFDGSNEDDRFNWTCLLVEGLREIKWRADPYRHLQMAEEKKLLVRSLVMGFSAEKDNQLGHKGMRYGEDGEDSDDDFDDFIAGKGKGLIFLLHGGPGLGKTLTAGKPDSLDPLACPKLTRQQKASPKAPAAPCTTCQLASSTLR